MGERFAKVGDLQLCYQSRGAPSGPTLLLLGGLGMQLISWPEELCERFVRCGFHVLSFDYRDSGRSSYLDELGLPDLLRAYRGDVSRLGYGLGELADDAVGLLDTLGIDQAHLFGVSMGGMVAQVLTITHRPRVLSLCSALSSTGSRAVGQMSNEALSVLLRPAAKCQDDAVGQWMKAWEVTRSPGFAHDVAAERARAVRAFVRSSHSAGSARHLAAILADGDRTAALQELEVPTLVLHGDCDRVINVSGGEATAAAIRGSRLLVIKGMGHDLPSALWGEIVDAVTNNAARAAELAPD